MTVNEDRNDTVPEEIPLRDEENGTEEKNSTADAEIAADRPDVIINTWQVVLNSKPQWRSAEDYLQINTPQVWISSDCSAIVYLTYTADLCQVLFPLLPGPWHWGNVISCLEAMDGHWQCRLNICTERCMSVDGKILIYTTNWHSSLLSMCCSWIVLAIMYAFIANMQTVPLELRTEMRKNAHLQLPTVGRESCDMPQKPLGDDTTGLLQVYLYSRPFTINGQYRCTAGWRHPPSSHHSSKFWWTQH